MPQAARGFLSLQILPIPVFTVTRLLNMPIQINATINCPSILIRRGEERKSRPLEAPFSATPDYEYPKAFNISDSSSSSMFAIFLAGVLSEQESGCNAEIIVDNARSHARPEPLPQSSPPRQRMQLRVSTGGTSCCTVGRWGNSAGYSDRSITMPSKPRNIQPDIFSSGNDRNNDSLSSTLRMPRAPCRRAPTRTSSYLDLSEFLIRKELHSRSYVPTPLSKTGVPRLNDSAAHTA
jgi:hypothetical protein